MSLHSDRMIQRTVRGIQGKKKLEHSNTEEHGGTETILFIYKRGRRSKRYLSHLKPLCIRKDNKDKFIGFGKKYVSLHHDCIVTRW